MIVSLDSEIKFRVESLDKKVLKGFAQDENLDLSDIMRRAAKDYIRARSSQMLKAQQTQLHAA